MDLLNSLVHAVIMARDPSQAQRNVNFVAKCVSNRLRDHGMELAV